MIDLHTHILPGVDDGSPSLENSVRVVERLGAEGLAGIVCTPHLAASAARDAPVESNRELLEELRSALPASAPVLHDGFEIMLDAQGCDLGKSGLSLGGSRAVLVELPRAPIGESATSELMRLRSSGLVPVIAHPERYQGISIDRLHVWRDMGVVVQGDGPLLLTAGPKGEFARRMLAEGVCDVIASDNHGDHRSLATIRMWLHEVGGDSQARLLLESNPARLLADEVLQPVPPLREAAGFWGRILSLFGRGRRPRGDS